MSLGMQSLAYIRLPQARILQCLVLLLCLSVPAIAQDGDTNNDQELIELTEAYAEIEQKLTDQSAELDRILKLGYGGPALGKDMADIAENVATLEARLEGLVAQLAILIKKLNYNPVMPFEITVHKDAKDTPPLVSSARPGDRIYLTADIKHAVLPEGMETRLSWALMLPDGTPSEILHKSEDKVRAGTGATYSFGIDTADMELGTYKMELVHAVVGAEKQQFKASTSFTLGKLSNLKITKMVIDDERSGDEHQRVLPEGAFPYMFAYFEAPEHIKALTADFRVRDMTDSKTIYAKKGTKKIKPDAPQQRFGVVLDPEQTQMTVGHEYRFELSLKDDLRDPNSLQEKLETVKDNITFFYGDEPKRIKIDKLVISNDAAAKSTPQTIAVSPTVFLTGWYKATKTVDSMDVLFRLTNIKDGETILETTVTQENQKDAALDKITLPVETEMLKEGAEYSLQTFFSGAGFETAKSARKFTYAKKPPPDMLKLVKVTGRITTAGEGGDEVDPKNTNPLKLDSSVTFNVPPVYPEGLEGVLYWRIDGKQQPPIALDGSNNNWGFTFDARTMGSTSSYSAVLFYRQSPRRRPQRLYSAKFGVSLPFYASTLGGDKPMYDENEKVGENGKKKRLPDWMGYPWIRDKVGIRVRSSDFDVKVKVTVLATLKETGQTLISETKTIEVAPKQSTELEWRLDQAALKFDLKAIFPNIEPERDFKKTIETKFTVEDDKGYKTEHDLTTTQWLYFLESDENFIKAPSGFEEKSEVGTIIPPAIMDGPYTTSTMGLSFYYTEGLDVKMRPEDLEAWAKEVNAPKVREDDEREYFAKTVPVLITLEDASGKQGAFFWGKYTFTAGLSKPPPGDNDD